MREVVFVIVCLCVGRRVVAAGRKAEAKAAAAAQLEAYRALPDAQKLPEAEAAAGERLKQLH